MNNFFRAIIAGYGAKKLGGGCFGTIIVFILIWVALGQCSFSSRKVPPPETFPAEHRAGILWHRPSTHTVSFPGHGLSLKRPATENTVATYGVAYDTGLSFTTGEAAAEISCTAVAV